MTVKHALRWLLIFTLWGALPGRAEVPANAVWIDVRTPSEYASGHLQGAVLIPFDGIEAGVARLQLSKDTPIYLYCAVGGRAEIARQRLQALEYTAVTNVGGLADAQKLTGRRDGYRQAPHRQCCKPAQYPAGRPGSV